jgi:hypothetical protein
VGRHTFTFSYTLAVEIVIPMGMSTVC